MADYHTQTASQRGQFVGMRKAGFSVSQIAREMGVSRPTVRLWLNRNEESGNLRDLPRTGRPRLITAEDTERILADISEHPFTNAVEVKTRLQVDFSTRTIRRRLNEAGVHHRIPAVKEFLEGRHIEGRLRFAQEYVEQNMDFWGRVIFTDEKTFSSTSHGQLHCWRLNNTRYDPKHVYQEARSGHVTANVWGWINLNSVGELAEIDGRFTADKYVEILEEVMLPTVRAYTLPYPERIVFMQVSILLLYSYFILIKICKENILRFIIMLTVINQTTLITKIYHNILSTKYSFPVKYLFY